MRCCQAISQVTSWVLECILWTTSRRRAHSEGAKIASSKPGRCSKEALLVNGDGVWFTSQLCFKSIQELKLCVGVHLPLRTV